MALENLRAADVDQQGLVDHFRSVSPVRARASLDAAAWDLLRAPGFDEVLSAIFVAVERPAIALRLEELYENRRLAPPDRERRLSETSTASIVRSFQWAARFLGIGCPDLYVVENAQGCSSLAAPTPSIALGPNVLSGQSAKDLAFLAGNHLTRYRPEYRVLSFYPTREDVTMLLFAAAQLGMPFGPAGSNGSVASLRARLARHAGDRERAALADAVGRLDARGGQATIGAWMRSMELTAARAGLLLCGDLATAAALIGSDLCAAEEPALAARRGDLVRFCASRAHAELRARFVTSAGSSVRHADNVTNVSHGA
jgi:golgin subfamily B member 1